MPVDLSIRGAGELQKVARQLKELGDKELRRDLYRGINRATKPLKAKAQQAALEMLPKGGGLNRLVAASKISTRTRAGQNPGVSLKSKRFGGIDRGAIRHPVFGNREVWVSQPVQPGWFSESMEDGAPVVRKELLEVLGDVARRLARG